MLRLNLHPDPRVLVGHRFADDAVVVEVAPGLALVQTVDFFTPVVDDPRRFGRVAAANALSDIYAMGGTPLTAMNVVCFPLRQLGTEVLSEILEGGYEKVREAGAILAGGHTVEDVEPKYGLAVTGVADPANLVTKGGARPGDLLVLTKPLGTGVMTTAHKNKDLSAEDLERVLEVMETLNAAASRCMVSLGARGGTDITGYGLLGHAAEMARASGVALEFEAAAVPLIPGAAEALSRGHLPGGSKANRRWLEEAGTVEWGASVSEVQRCLLTDAQTSGGLLVALPPEAAEVMLAGLPSMFGAPAVVGRILGVGALILRVV